MNSRLQRGAGVLLHPTSLPSPYGIGDLGPAAHAWVDTLARARQSWWQILPLGPTGFGDSPYQCFSAFAGNVFLLSPELLIRDGLINAHDVAGHYFSDEKVEYGRVIPYKLGLLRRAWENFRAGQVPWMREAFSVFCSENREWLDDYALFMALKDARRGASWTTWPRELMRTSGDSKLIEFTRQELTEEVGLHQFGQYLFFRQWNALREHARARGVRIIGDIPIFVSPDSADVWANPKLFLLDASMRPKVVAGVPPDYFSPTGQLWGNPLYDWKAMRATSYRWWVARLRATMDMVDLVRLDHFRGFCAAWHIPYGEATAVNGRWVPGPGTEMFSFLQKELGGLPLIAEDLGEITPDVNEMRDHFQLPGMKILQFAFDGPANPFLPHNYSNSNWVVYTGTHDNDTTRGWFHTLSDHERWFYGRYTCRDGNDISWDLIRMGWSSPAVLAVAPAQDILDYGTDCRMNFPGKPDGNWQWRMNPGAFSDHIVHRLGELTDIYGRVPAVK
ncbi:MAG: 4-alpha-glucanotransferase [Planctomycetes bacterium]|nr:4-alpha-glucanotransferase [Planctomycetota bacterium]